LFFNTAILVNAPESDKPDAILKIAQAPGQACLPRRRRQVWIFETFSAR